MKQDKFKQKLLDYFQKIYIRLIMSKTKNILCLFDYGKKVNTGYSRQSTEIVKSVKKQFGENIRLDIIASGYVPEEIHQMCKEGMPEEYIYSLDKPFENITTYYKESENCTVYSAVYHEGLAYRPEYPNCFLPYKIRGVFGQHLFVEMLELNPAYNYDGIFILQDIGVVLPIIEELKRIKLSLKEKGKKQFKSVFYFPIDGEYPAITYPDSLLFFDKLITYTEFARKEIISKNPVFKGKLSVIPHGISIKDFFRAAPEKVESFRNDYFGTNSNKFIVGVINRNQFRKDMPTAIFSFYEVWKENKNLFLYLHCYPKDPLGWDLRRVLLQTDMKEGIDYSFPKKDIMDIPVIELNMIYNSIDVYLSTSLGEGFGLTAIECFATQTLTILPDNTAYSELIRERNENFRCLYYEMGYSVACIQDNVIRKQGYINEIVDLINYSSFSYMKNDFSSLVKKAYNFVQTLSWINIGKLWVDIFKTY